MANSRIFVRSLPLSLREDEFRNHFASFAPITDVKLFPQRRIGYVGYRSDQDAVRAVKHFNKSYIRMSRIGVELADNGFSKPQANQPTSLDTPASEQPKNILKRKRNQDSKPEDGKWKEYLDLMKPPTQIRSWEAQPEPSATVQDESLRPIHPGDPNSGVGTNEHDPTSIPRTSSTLNDNVLPSQVNYENIPNPPGPSAASTVNPPEKLSEESQIPSSDADWMRSRTSRLLGLLDYDEEDGQINNLEQGPASPSPDLPATTEITKPDNEKHDNNDLPSPKNAPEIDISAIENSHRLFLRNLSYDVAETDLETHFQDFGSIEEIHVPRDPKSGQAKGFAFIQFKEAEEAVEAYQKRDGTVFQGRLLHILPAAAKRTTEIDDHTLSKLPLKKQRQIQKKKEATSSSFNWNSLFINSNSVLSSISDRLGVAKSEILDPSSTDASVKLAQAETHIIQETKEYFTANGINLEAFKNHQRDECGILVKNFPYGTTSQDLKELFSAHGYVTQVLIPPSGTIAIVKFELPVQAKAAFAALAYRKYKESILFLEKAPKGVFKGDAVGINPRTKDSAPRLGATDLLQPEEDAASAETATLFVRNLNFATSVEGFRELFQALDGFVSARIKTKSNPNKPGEVLSMGFGFVEFRSAQQARAALAAMNGYLLDNHHLVVKASHKGNDAAQERKNLDETKKRAARKSKLVIKNLPFEASKKDVRNLFKSYGQLRAVRVPKKFDNSRKGYAFAEFSNAREAESALESLRNTHLLGRRLVLDYAAEDAEDPEQEIANMQRKVGKQANTVAIQRLTSGAERKKVNIAGEGNENNW